ncbi:MAG: hypothetical protein PUI98_07155 [Finegoldia magna]|nr:hypothetical protein [Finegoldia magna]
MKNTYTQKEIKRAKKEITENGISYIGYWKSLTEQFNKDEFLEGMEFLFEDGISYKEFWSLSDSEREVWILDALINEMNYQEFKLKVFPHLLSTH